MVYLSFFNDPEAGEFFNGKFSEESNEEEPIARNLITYHPHEE